MVTYSTLIVIVVVAIVAIVVELVGGGSVDAVLEKVFRLTGYSRSNSNSNASGGNLICSHVIGRKTSIG